MVSKGEWRRGLPPGRDALLSGRVQHEAALRVDLEAELEGPEVGI
jgi:hypothetical protein